MLLPPIEKNKTKDNLRKTKSEAESQGIDRSSGWAGYSSLSLGGENRSVQAKQGNDRSQGWQPMSLSSLSQGGVLQRKRACGSSAGSVGTCGECDGKEGAMLQTKLSIGTSDDKYEREADRVADEVMRMPEPTIQRQMEPEEDVEEMVQTKAINNSITPLQRSSTAPNQSAEVPDIVHEVLRSPGQPLDSATRALMEPRFGHDFSQVRVHTGGDADRSAREVNAHAYTVEQDIVFGAGQYTPGTREGRYLLAHELTHTLQQKGNNTVIQRMLACPSQLADTAPTPSGWKSYFGDPSIFHCGFRTILEDRIPTPRDPQNECVYDHSSVLVDENHLFAGCRGTPDQYDSASSPIDHTFRDSGGIWNAGGPAFLTSQVYTLSRPIAVAIEVVTTSENIISSVVDGFESSIALAVLTAQASVDPGNWRFQRLPSRSIRHLNVMGSIISSAALSQNVETLLINLTRRLDSFPIAGLLDEMAQDINQVLKARRVTTPQVTSSDLSVLSLIQLVEWLRIQGIMQYLRPPEDIAREKLVAQQRATP